MSHERENLLGSTMGVGHLPLWRDDSSWVGSPLDPAVVSVDTAEPGTDTQIGGSIVPADGTKVVDKLDGEVLAGLVITRGNKASFAGCDQRGHDNNDSLGETHCVW